MIGNKIRISQQNIITTWSDMCKYVKMLIPVVLKYISVLFLSVVHSAEVLSPRKYSGLGLARLCTLTFRQGEPKCLP